MKNSIRYWIIYSTVITWLFITVVVWLWYQSKTGWKLDRITAQQIQIQEPDGTLRMILSNNHQFPGIIVKGREEEFNRPQAGILFYNDEGSENGGIIFSGYMDDDGKVVNAGGSLTFDRYGGNQELQLISVNDEENKFSGLIIRDSPPDSTGYRRIWLGKNNNGTIALELKDAKGRTRISLSVTAEGTADISTFDEAGNRMQK